jgi:hypothetical protein
MLFNCHPKTRVQAEDDTSIVKAEVPITTIENASEKDSIPVSTITVKDVVELSEDSLPVSVNSVSNNGTEESERENNLYYAKDQGKEFYLDAVYQDYLWEKLKEYNHTDLYELCMALMLHESHFTINIVSKTNDHGLMQINGGNYTWMHNTLGIDSLDDPYDNIDCGVYILVSAYEKFGDVESALVCYNTGGGHMVVGKTYSTSYSQCVVSDMDKLYLLQEEADGGM